MKKEWEGDSKKIVDYNEFATTFAKSRKNKEWPEVEYCVQNMMSSFEQWGLDILDVGCGNGRLINALKKQGWVGQYLGIDSSKNMIAEAQKEHSDCQFLVVDMLDIALIEQRFDSIFLVASFHHLPTQEKRHKVLEKMKNLLKQKGKIYMINWNLYSEENYTKYASSEKEAGEFEIKIWEHTRYYHGFSIKELEDLFIDTGYIVEENSIFEGERNIVSILKKS